MTHKIAFATGSRADYGIVRRYLRRLNAHPDISLSVLATGALLDSRYGYAVEQIRRDGFTVACEIDLRLDSTSDSAVLNSMAIALSGFGRFLEKHRYDLLILLGDRYEMLSVATAAAMHKIPILHLHGGEATFANYDEFIRHAITKMSTYHFTATARYRQRVIQLGEAPERVFCLGALGAYNCTVIDEKQVLPAVKALPHKRYFVVLFHPETLSSADPTQQVRALLDAIDRFIESYHFVFIGSNADTHADQIRRMVQTYIRHHADRCTYFETVGSDSYHYLLQHAVCLIGNSSSGLIEAPSLGVYTVNVGDRQKGRERGGSVLDVPCSTEAIVSAMQTAMTGTPPMDNPYYRADAEERYVETTVQLLQAIPSTTAAKIFYDLPPTNGQAH